jgi:RNA polymerase sigma-70 factor (ECF subfamily)
LKQRYSALLKCGEKCHHAAALGVAMSPVEQHTAPGPSGWFATTHWSVVLGAARGTSPQADAALEALCRTYWYPLYAYVRRQGHSAHDAQDLTQAFFERLLAKNFLAHVDRSKGRFRSFLLAALKHFLADERDRASRLKRGGGHTLLSWDEQAAEDRYGLERVAPKSAKSA